jgi:hypothetical protein
MDGRPPDPYRQPATQLQPRLAGRSIPLPPVAAVVAVFGILAGFVSGYALVPKSASAPTAARTAVAISPGQSLPLRSVVAGRVLPSAAVGDATAGPTLVDLPQGRGLSIADATAALEKSGIDVRGTDVLSARLARFGEIETPPRPSDQWVWVFVLRLVFPPIVCGVVGATPAPCPDATTEMIAIDYQTGELVEDRVPAYP